MICGREVVIALRKWRCWNCTAV